MRRALFQTARPRADHARLANQGSILGLGGLTFLMIQPGMSQGVIPEPPEDTVASRIPRAETGFERDHMTGNWGGLRDRWVEHGFHLSSGYTGEVFANLDGGEKTGAVYEGLWELGLDIDPSRFSAWRQAMFHVAMLYPHGSSPSGQLVGDLSTVSNLDADDSMRLFELWFEQNLWRDRVSIRLGQLAADQEYAGSDHGALFLNASFGWPLFLSANTPTPAYPQGAPGARLRIQPTDAFHFQAAIHDGNPDPGNAQGHPVNEHGFRVNLNGDEGALILGEAVWVWRNRDDQDEYRAQFKLGAAYNTSDFEHLSRDTTGQLLGSPSSNGQPDTVHGNYMVYFVADPWLWTEPSDLELESARQGLGAFFRVGGSPDDRSPIDWCMDAGLNFRGVWPGRDEDTAGLAVAYAHLSDELAKVARQTGEPEPDYEIVVEAAYEIKLRPWWFMQPDFQYVIHPGGSSELSNAIVVGLRTSLIF